MLIGIVSHLLNIEMIDMSAYYLSFTPYKLQSVEYRYLSDQLLMQLMNVNYAIVFVSVISDGKWSEAFKMMNFSACKHAFFLN